MKNLFALLIFCLFTFPLLGQDGFYSSDSLLVVGLKLIDNGILNHYTCSVSSDSGIVLFTPDEINEYGLNDGRVYEAFNVTVGNVVERYFLEQYVDGKVSLYALKLKGSKIKYYLTSDGQADLIELPKGKSECKIFIEHYAEECQYAAKNLKYLKPNKYSLIRYFKDLNDCDDKPFPRINFGFRMGLCGVRHIPIKENSIIGTPDYSLDISYSIGSFIEMPVHSSNLSVLAEINFRKNHLAESFVNVSDYDLVMNYTSVNIPMLLRYNFIKEGCVPFFQIGPTYSRIIKNESVLYEYYKTNKAVFVNISDPDVLQNDLIGFSVGTGIQSGYWKNYALFAELRYSRFYNFQRLNKNFNLGESSFLLGVKF